MVPPPIWLIAGGAAVAAGAVALLSGQNRAAAILVALGVLLPVAALLADRATARAGDLDIEKVADRLADLVRDQWDIEATRRGVGRPPLEVFWRAADEDLVHTWPELLQQAVTGRSGPAAATPGSGPEDLAGHGALLAAYDRSPCGRLVVLGDRGAGKTVLLLRLVLDLLNRRQPGQPVLLLLPLASWNPDGPSLYTWIETQILREYPHLAAVDAATGRKRAGALLDAGLILPVLDGLDEIRTGARGQALTAINQSLRSNIGLVLSCRSEEFRAAVQPDPAVRPIHLDGAAGVRLTPLGPETVKDYLLAGAGSDGPARWTPTLTSLTSPASPLAQALTTPLTASLASTIYNPRPGESALGLPNPADLAALPTAEAVEQHLLAGFVPAAYRPHPDQPARWTADQATGYLTFLARHLEHRLGTTSLAWWEIPRATPRALLVLAIWPTFGLTFGLRFGLADGLAVGLAVGFLIGLRSPAPSRVALRRPRSTDLAGGLAVGITGGLGLGLSGWLSGWLSGGLTGGFTVGLTAGLIFGILITLASGLGLNSPTDTQVAASPTATLNQDRISALTFGLAVGLTFGLAVGLAYWLTYVNVFVSTYENLHENLYVDGYAHVLGNEPEFGYVDKFRLVGELAFKLLHELLGGLPYGLMAGLAVGLDSAWARLGLARLWLAAHRQQPLHLIAFLEDAHDRGVLRQAGAVWEFRHAELQRYLAGPP